MIPAHTALCQGLNVSYQVYRLTLATLPGAIFFIMAAIYIFLAFLFLVNLLVLFRYFLRVNAKTAHSQIVGTTDQVLTFYFKARKDIWPVGQKQGLPRSTRGNRRHLVQCKKPSQKISQSHPMNRAYSIQTTAYFVHDNFFC